MAQKTRQKKKGVETPMTTLGESGGASSPERPTLNSDPFPQPPHADLGSGTAAIATVTDAMMDHAAHLLTEQVDDLTHGEIVPGDQAMETATGAVETAVETTRSADEIVGEAVQQGGASSEATVTEVTQAFDAAGMHVAATGGDVAEQTLGPSEEVAARAQEAVGSVGKAGDAGLPGASEAFSRYNAKLFEMMRTNLAASNSHFTALLQAKSVPDAIALNADHLRRQLDTMTAQGRELTTLAQKITFDVLQPLTTVVGSGR